MAYTLTLLLYAINVNNKQGLLHVSFGLSSNYNINYMVFLIINKMPKAFDKTITPNPLLTLSGLVVFNTNITNYEGQAISLCTLILPTMG